jgi:hypothetical protein
MFNKVCVTHNVLYGQENDCGLHHRNCVSWPKLFGFLSLSKINNDESFGLQNLDVKELNELETATNSTNFNQIIKNFRKKNN